MDVYLIRNLANGKIYVGKTIAAPQQRWMEHVAESRRDSQRALCRAIRKYGELAFDLSVIATASSKEELADMERGYIKTLQSNKPSIGYNQTAGGDGGRTWYGQRHSEQTKRRISASLKALNPSPMIDLLCALCGKQFSRTLRYHRQKCKEGQSQFYCSRAHAAQGSRSQQKRKSSTPRIVTLICGYCGDNFERLERYYRAALRRGQELSYCNHSHQLIHQQQTRHLRWPLAA